MAIKIAINGFGRIGRQTFKSAIEMENLEIVAINDLTDAEILKYLLEYDSVYGRYGKEVKVVKNGLMVDGKEFKIFSEKDPGKLPWKKLNIDIVLECTGFFTEKKMAQKHLEAGASQVIISAPAKDGVKTIVQGVNENDYDLKNDSIISNASCTTNALAPVSKILDDNFGIEKSLMTTIHSYTSTQSLVDGPNMKDFRRGRAAAENLVLTTTGAAKATCKVLPKLDGKFNGMAVRVPTPVVSLVDMTAVLSKSVDAKKINNVFSEAAKNDFKGIVGVTNEPLVSCDFRQDSRLAIVDMSSTMAIDNLVKMYVWYDNEWGYSYGLARMADIIGNKLK